MLEVVPALLHFLKNPDRPGAMLLFAIVIGALVRVLRTKKVGELLDAAPPSWIKRVPKWMLPWIGVAIGFVLAVLNARFNVGSSWFDALGEGLTGALAGWMAIGGHETVGKIAGFFLYKPFGPFNPPPKPPGSADPPLPAVMKKETSAVEVDGAAIAEAVARANDAKETQKREAFDPSKPLEIDAKRGGDS